VGGRRQVLVDDEDTLYAFTPYYGNREHFIYWTRDDHRHGGSRLHLKYERRRHPSSLRRKCEPLGFNPGMKGGCTKDATAAINSIAWFSWIVWPGNPGSHIKSLATVKTDFNAAALILSGASS